MARYFDKLLERLTLVNENIVDRLSEDEAKSHVAAINEIVDIAVTLHDTLEATAKSYKYDGTQDQPIAEDIEIQECFHALHKTALGGKIYTYAHRLVSAKHSKAALVNLVNWLIWKQSNAMARATALELEISRLHAVIDRCVGIVSSNDIQRWFDMAQERSLTPDEIKQIMQTNGLELRTRKLGDRFKIKTDKMFDEGTAKMKTPKCQNPDFHCKKGTFTPAMLSEHLAAENAFGQSAAYKEAHEMVVELLKGE